MVTIGTGAGKCVLKFQIGSIWTKDFIFQTYDSETENYSDDDLSGATFSFFIKKNIGDRLKIFNLTLNNGIQFVTYISNEIRITASASQTSIEEGEYYFELRRTDLDKAVVCGQAFFSYDA